MPARSTPPEDETAVAELWNLSDKTAGWLEDVGVKTYGDLRSRDLLELWAELKLAHRQVTKLMYYALWGAVHNRHWNEIPDSEKAALDDFIERAF